MTARPRALGATAAACWPALDRLLDEALDLEESERAAWLDALPPSPQKDLLAGLLVAPHAGPHAAPLARTPGPPPRLPATRVFSWDHFLGTLPPLTPAALSTLSDPSRNPGLRPGDEVGPWRIVRELGQGGMASVWLAERSDGTLKRQVALKLPLTTWQEGLADRLQRERDILATLEHPNIARLYDAGVDALGRPWLALEFVQGRPIDEYVKAAACDLRTRVRLVVQVAQAVAYAHSRLVIHRDIKPSNILADEAGQVHLLDFGIAKLMQGEHAEETALTRAAGRALTLDYASPEQVRGEPLSTASDVYSLAVVAFELLTGTRPYRPVRGTAAELEELITAGAPPLASEVAQGEAQRKALRGDLDAILNQALKKAPAERYASVDALAQDLLRHLAGERVAARPDSLAYRARRVAAQHGRALLAATAVAAGFAVALGAGATALVIVTLALGLAAALWQARRAEATTRQARQQAARAQAVQRFLLDIFNANTDRQPDAAKARQATARDLLDRGAARVETALADAPEARIEVMGTLAQMYSQLMHFEQAAAIQQRLVTLSREHFGQRDRRVAEALVGLANIRFHLERGEQVVPLLREAQAMLDAIGEPDSLLRGRLLGNLAKCHQKISVSATRAYAEEAVRVLEAGAPSVHLSTALQMAGAACMDLGRLADAERHLRRACKVLEGLASTPQVALAQVRSTLADCLGQQHRLGEALAAARTAHEGALAALGEADVGTLFLASRVGYRMHFSGEREAGRALMHSALAGVPDAARGDAYIVPQMQRWLARALYLEGDVAAAHETYTLSLQAQRMPLAGTVALARVQRDAACAAAAVGESEAAAALFDEALANWQAGAGDGALGWPFNRFLLDQATVRFEAGAGDAAAAARALLACWIRVDAAEWAWPVEELERDLLLARIALAEGQVAAALELATGTAAAVAGSPAPRELPTLWVDSQWVLASALLAAGRAADAEPAARIAVDWRCRHDVAASPWTAEAERVLAECRLAQGRPDEALEWAGRAAGRHAAAARLAAHLREPLNRLLERLRAGG